MASNIKESLSLHDEAILNNIFNHAEPLTDPSETCFHQSTVDELKGKKSFPLNTFFLRPNFFTM